MRLAHGATALAGLRTFVSAADLDVTRQRRAARLVAAEHFTNLFRRLTAGTLPRDGKSLRGFLLQSLHGAPHDSRDNANQRSRPAPASENLGKHRAAAHQV